MIECFSCSLPSFTSAIEPAIVHTVVNTERKRRPHNECDNDSCFFATDKHMPSEEWQSQHERQETIII
jgi:hypothetical protein